MLSNRGANGIDGVVSTAVGAALTGAPTALLIGDVAFLHDTNGLLGLMARDVNLVIVVVDNDGGGIFSFLPQRDELADDDASSSCSAPPTASTCARWPPRTGCRPSEWPHAPACRRRSPARSPVAVPRVVVVQTDRAANVGAARRAARRRRRGVGPPRRRRG